MSTETSKTTSFIPLGDIDLITVHIALKFYLIVLKAHSTWYAKEFTATPEGLKGNFQSERF